MWDSVSKHQVFLEYLEQGYYNIRNFITLLWRVMPRHCISNNEFCSTYALINSQWDVYTTKYEALDEVGHALSNISRFREMMNQPNA